MNNNLPKESELILFSTPEGNLKVEVIYKDETVWLSQNQLSLLFNIDRSVITKHLKNIFKTNELDEKSVCANFAHTASDSKKYNVNFYNLDAIISVGYRVNSTRATQFRIWATTTLKDHILKGYSLNTKMLSEANEKFSELQNAINLLLNKSDSEQLAGRSTEILELLSTYAKTLTLLESYDSGKIVEPKGLKTNFILKYTEAQNVLADLKKELVKKGEASVLFGNERDYALESILGNIYQTFSGQDLYPTLESKAAHLLYFVIKDHPLTDGNKRSGAFLFIYFLDRCNALFKKNGERKINDNALTALALLIAESDPNEKDVIIKMIMNLIVE